MRMNPKAYNVASESTPFEVEEFDGRTVELYYLNEFDVLMDEFTNKGKFDVWSSEDGVNYRLYIEEGYYNAVKELYSQPVNKISLDFWDECEKITKKSTSRLIVPLTILAFIACIGVSFIPGEVGTYLSLGIIAAAFIGMMVINNMSKKKIHDQNVKSVDLIKKHVGEKRFEKLLDLKKDYVDEYFNALYPDEEEAEEKLEETKEEEISE